MENASTRTVAGFRFLRLRDPLGRRLLQLLPGLVLFGVSIAMALKANLGTNPWTVFHEGVSDRLGSAVSFGMVVIGTGLLLVLLFRIVDEPLGLGTALNVLVIGIAVDVSLLVIPDQTEMLWRVVLLGASPLFWGWRPGSTSGPASVRDRGMG